MIDHALIEFTKESGEVLLTERYSTEQMAQEEFDRLATVKWPYTHKGLVLNLSEFPEGRIGSVRLIAVSNTGERFERRELFRKP